jgi:hypothetical protein
MADEPKGAPPVLPKSRRLERVEKGARADTGGDMYDRFRGNYSKNPAPKDDSPFFLDNVLKR